MHPVGESQSESLLKMVSQSELGLNISIFKLRERSFFVYLCRSVGWSDGRLAGRSVKKMQKVQKIGNSAYVWKHKVF